MPLQTNRKVQILWIEIPWTCLCMATCSLHLAAKKEKQLMLLCCLLSCSAGTSCQLTTCKGLPCLTRQPLQMKLYHIQDGQQTCHKLAEQQHDLQFSQTPERVLVAAALKGTNTQHHFINICTRKQLQAAACGGSHYDRIFLFCLVFHQEAPPGLGQQVWPS